MCIHCYVVNQYFYDSACFPGQDNLLYDLHQTGGIFSDFYVCSIQVVSFIALFYLFFLKIIGLYVGFNHQ
ncbi:hypothetical protein CDG60_10480 [Acinetobacter chinensis]|uniref:Uncharacterized protein n=1 Tax=Acinetobacter chinensis TaxID=2004650 RepID=A0A3B7LVQ4_9GAMM|nr:hypothetical protein CDG60_10480 [Acinetobacter chinensis]